MHGGAYFGVPITNFFGWFLTVCMIYQSFGILLQRQSLTQAHLPASHWRQAVIFYGVSAVGNLLLVLPQNRYSMTTCNRSPVERERHYADLRSCHSAHDGSLHHFGLVAAA